MGAVSPAEIVREKHYKIQSTPGGLIFPSMISGHSSSHGRTNCRMNTYYPQVLALPSPPSGMVAWRIYRDGTFFCGRLLVYSAHIQLGSLGFLRAEGRMNLCTWHARITARGSTIWQRCPTCKASRVISITCTCSALRVSDL